MTTGSRPSGARIVYDEDRRGWLIEEIAGSGEGLLVDRLFQTEAEAQDLLRLRGYSHVGSDESEWPWEQGRGTDRNFDRPCVDDWVRNDASRVLPFEGDERR